MNIKTINVVWLLLPLLLLKADDEWTCRSSKCVCHTIEKFEDGVAGREKLQCFHKFHQQNMSIFKNRITNEVPFLFLEVMWLVEDVFLTVECYNFHLKDKNISSTTNTSLFDLIPKLDLGRGYVMIRLSKCPLPEESFQSLYRILNTTNVKQLIIDSSPSEIHLIPPYFENHPSVEFIAFRQNAGLNELSSDLFKGLNNLKTLELTGNNITTLDPFVFQHLISLVLLDISYNKITALDSGIFQNLTFLQFFDMSYNQIVILSSNLFWNVPNLKRINISFNKISILPSGIFDNLIKLEEFTAINNTFQKFPSGLFSKTEKLRMITIETQSALTVLPEKFLANLPDLWNVILNDCGIEDLPSNLFWNSKSLNMISLSGHKKLTSIPRDLFRDCPNLYSLNLANNGLSGLEKNTFATLKGLPSLDLSGNRLETIIGDVFNGTLKLEHLSLNDNKLKFISNITFSKLCKKSRSLTSLDLSNNFLKLGPDEPNSFSQLKSCDRLEKLFLSGNRITQIYKDWMNPISQLEELSLERNNITSIPDYVLSPTSCTELEFFEIKETILEMDLSYNQIEVVEFTSNQLERLNPKNKVLKKLILNFQGNPIACNCSNYDLFRFIQDKAVHDEYKPIVFDGTSDVNTCSTPNVSINQIDLTNLTCDIVNGCPSPCKCSYLPHNDLITVNCTSANLAQMPQHLNVTLMDNRAISRLWNVTKNRSIQLVLRNNSIQEFLLGPLDGYELVTELDLSFNQIKHEKDVIIQNFPQLKVLNLTHNHLQSLSQKFINLVLSSKITSLFLSGNPWKCDCHITSLYGIIKPTNDKLEDPEKIICNGSDIPLHSIQSSEEFCPVIEDTGNDDFLLIVIIISLVIFIMVGLLTICLYYKYQHPIRVWLFAHRLLVCCVSEEDMDKDKVYDAFVSYSQEDYGFVVHTLLPKLETSFKICHHERDFIGGKCISSQIDEKVRNSRRIIIVLTKHFVNSYWGMYEFQTAYERAKKDNCARVIMLLLGDMPPQEGMSEEMKAYLSTHTYNKWVEGENEAWFWAKLKFAMPHRSARPTNEFPMTSGFN